MNTSTRYFLFQKDGSLHMIPRSRFNRVYAGKEALPEFAGQQARWVTVVVALEDKQPAEIVQFLPAYLAFDERGYVRLDRRVASITAQLDGDEGDRTDGDTPQGAPGASKGQTAGGKAGDAEPWCLKPADQAAIRRMILIPAT